MWWAIIDYYYFKITITICQTKKDLRWLRLNPLAQSISSLFPTPMCPEHESGMGRDQKPNWVKQGVTCPWLKFFTLFYDSFPMPKIFSSILLLAPVISKWKKRTSLRIISHQFLYTTWNKSLGMQFANDNLSLDFFSEERSGSHFEL